MKNKILYILIIFILLSCLTTNETSDKTENNTPTVNIIPESELPLPPTLEELEHTKITQIIKKMTIEEKVGQLFILDIRGYKTLTPYVKNLIETYKPGGIILFANNIETNKQVLDLIDNMQKTSAFPLFISVDEEGGIVSRLGKAKGIDVTHLPPALEVGKHNNPQLAYNSGKILGRELSALGFNMDMAPDADVNTNPSNPVIGNRTYSADPHIAGEMVENAIKGFQSENIIAVIKHFPGHGDTSTDSHLGTVISPHNRERLDQIEFIPFIQGINAGVDAIMTAHMTMPGISSTLLPATLNPEIITGILREDFKFNGIIMTDAMDMGAITYNFSSEEATKLAIKAGIDIILIPQKNTEAINSILTCIETNEITEERIEQSLYRIIKLKFKRGILDQNNKRENIKNVQEDINHQELIHSIFNKRN